MTKRVCLFLVITAAVFLGCAGICCAQTGSLEDLKSQIRASVRSEMGLDRASANTPTTVKVKEGASLSGSAKSKIDMPIDAPLPKYIAVMVLTVGVTVFLMKIFGGRKKGKEKKKPGSKKEETPDDERLGQEGTDKKAAWGPPEKNLSGGETAIDIYEKIERIQALRNKGVISEEEFSVKKKELLDRI